MNLLKEYLEVNKKFFLFVSIIFLIGIASGSIFTLVLNDNDSFIISEFLSNYLESIKNNKINYYNAFINSINCNFLIVTVIFILGFSIIGLPITILLLFYKSFIIGFSISSIIINYKAKGLLLSFLYVFPHQICLVLSMISLVIYSMIISISFIKSVISHSNMIYSSRKYFIIYLITIVLVCLISIYETFILPFLIRFMV